MFGYPYEIGYGSSKAAVIYMTKNAANENGFNGVRINAVSPGWVDTNMMKTVVDSYKDVGIENSSDQCDNWTNAEGCGTRGTCKCSYIPGIRGSFLCKWGKLLGGWRNDTWLKANK